jgi:hypothetical protein
MGFGFCALIEKRLRFFRKPIAARSASTEPMSKSVANGDIGPSISMAILSIFLNNLPFPVLAPFATATGPGEHFKALNRLSIFTSRRKLCDRHRSS